MNVSRWPGTDGKNKKDFSLKKNFLFEKEYTWIMKNMLYKVMYFFTSFTVVYLVRSCVSEV